MTHLRCRKLTIEFIHSEKRILKEQKKDDKSFQIK